MLPTKTSKGYISPAEFFTSDAPNASELKIWGCKAWAIVPKEQRRKEWKEKGKPGYYMGVSEQPVGHQIYIPDLDDTVVTVHARFDEQIPERSQEYFEEIDNHLSTEVLEKAERIDDYMYLVGLKHYDGHIPYITTRVVERRGLIVAYRKLAREGNTTEEQTPIHIKDIVQMTLAANRQSDEFNELKHDMIDDVDDVVSTTPLSCNKKIPVVSCPDKTEKNRETKKCFRKKRDLLNVGILGDVSLFLNSRTQDIIQELQTLLEAKQTPLRAYWIEATRKVIYKLERRTCWKITRRPKDRKIIKSKLVFKIKRDYLGSVKKFRVRLVAKGFTQEHGIDYKETFSPVAKGVSFRLSLALALRYNLQLRQLDVETAFPYADLEEDVYMSPPAGIDIPKGCCLKILKSLYSLKRPETGTTCSKTQSDRWDTSSAP